MLGRLWRVLALGVTLGTGMGCGPAVDLGQALEPTDVFTGWYDAGVKNGLNHLVPSVSFRLRNRSDVPITQVQLTVSFWQEGADGEKESKEVRGIGGDRLEPAASTDPILVRSEFGYTLEQPRSDLFTHSQFKDWIVKLFAKRGGKISPLGEFKLERRILPHASLAADRP